MRKYQNLKFHFSPLSVFGLSGLLGAESSRRCMVRFMQKLAWTMLNIIVATSQSVFWKKVLVWSLECSKFAFMHKNQGNLEPVILNKGRKCIKCVIEKRLWDVAIDAFSILYVHLWSAKTRWPWELSAPTRYLICTSPLVSMATGSRISLDIKFLWSGYILIQVCILSFPLLPLVTIFVLPCTPPLNF